MDEVIKGIYIFLSKVSENFVLPENIYLGYQNEGSVNNDNFIIFYIIGKDIKSTPVYKDNIIDNQITYKNIAYVDFQVDVYGDNSLDVISKLEAYLNSRAANDFFKKNNINMSTFINQPVLNLSNILDNKNFTQRYTSRFTLFTNYDLTIDYDYFNYDEFKENFKLYLVQNNKIIN